MAPHASDVARFGEYVGRSGKGGGPSGEARGVAGRLDTPVLIARTFSGSHENVWIALGAPSGTRSLNFSLTGRLRAESVGATHSQELEYVFDTFGSRTPTPAAQYDASTMPFRMPGSSIGPTLPKPANRIKLPQVAQIRSCLADVHGIHGRRPQTHWRGKGYGGLSATCSLKTSSGFHSQQRCR